MHKFVRNLITEWRRLGLPVRDETVVVAVSGGADSVSLLLALDELRKLAKLDLRIVAAHLDHALRGQESDDDVEFIRELTTERRIELALHRSHISTDGNLEQNARVARYGFLAETAKNLDAFAVLTGHTVNDQAETFLLNLIRGSGVQGLGAMKIVRNLGETATATDPEPLLFPLAPSGIQLIRPLLNWAMRGDTENFCREMGVEFRYDTMNEDHTFARVRVRKILIPLLEEFNPKIIETLANTASFMQDITDSSAVTDDQLVMGDMSVSRLKTLPKGELYAAIRAWLGQQRGNTRQLQLKHIQAIERLIFSEKSGKTAELPGGRITKSGGELVYDENKVEN